MTTSPFLENLKKAVDTGDFNSEAAKKIKAVDELADQKIDPEELVTKRLEASGIKTASVTEEEAEVINAEYELKMKEIKEKDLVLQQIKTLQEIDETVMLSIQDMRDFVQTLEESFDKENPIHADIFTEIGNIKNKYSSIINK
jgi:hypothetical protein